MMCRAVGSHHGAKGAAIQDERMLWAHRPCCRDCCRGERLHMGKAGGSWRTILPRIGNLQHLDAMSQECREKLPLIGRQVAMPPREEQHAAKPRHAIATNKKLATVTEGLELRCERRSRRARVRQEHRVQSKAQRIGPGEKIHRGQSDRDVKKPTCLHVAGCIQRSNLIKRVAHPRKWSGCTWATRFKAAAAPWTKLDGDGRRSTIVHANAIGTTSRSEKYDAVRTVDGIWVLVTTVTHPICHHLAAVFHHADPD